MITLAGGIIASIAGVGATFAIARMLSHMPRVSGPIAFSGQRSLDIFVMHVIVLAAIRALLLKFGVESVAVHVVLGTAGAVAVPLLFGVLARRIHLGWLFEMPRSFRR